MLFLDSFRERKRRRDHAVIKDAGVRWQRQVERRAREVAGSPTWSAFEAERSLDACRLLAELARWLERTNQLGQRELTESLLGSEGDSFPATRKVVAAVVSKIVVSEVGGLGRAARALRVLGVLICAGLGTLEKCPCWRGMVKEGLDRAREQLRRGLPVETTA